MSILLRTLIAFGCLYLLFCLLAFVLQRQVIYHPDSRSVALDVGELAGAEVVTLATGDNETLLAWWVPPREVSAVVYLYLPGNADTLAARAERFALLTRDGAGLLAVSWRGYGGSSGTPTEAGLQQDAAAAYQWLGTHVATEQIIVFGESLGSGVAVALVATQPSGALVLDAAYSSLLAVAQRRMPWLPALLMQDKFLVERLAPQISVPVVQRHCTADPILPFALAQRLFTAFGSDNKQFISVEGRCHLPALTPLLVPLRQLEQLLRRVEP